MGKALKYLLRSLAGLILLVVLVGGVCLWYYHVEMRDLKQRHDNALQRIEKRLREPLVRPVLRGEAKPGNGGPVLARVLGEIRERSPSGWKRDWILLSQLDDGTLDPGDVEEAHGIYGYARSLLPRVRDALQHESCRLPDLSYDHDRHLNWILRGLGRALRLQARDRAAAGDLRGALENSADAIRFGHDLASGPPTPLWETSSMVLQREAVEDAATMLASHPFPPDLLEGYLRELSILDESLPPRTAYFDTWGDYHIVYDYRLVRLNAPNGALKRLANNTVVGGCLIVVGGHQPDAYRSLWREFREIYEKPLPDVRRETPAFLQKVRRSGLLASFAEPWLNPFREKEVELHDRTTLACLRAAVMVHKHLAAHRGSWPHDLSEIGEIPIDPWDGRPLRYRPPSGDRPACIYSVAHDSEDDGGQASEPLRCRSEANPDFVFPLGPWPEAEKGGDAPR